MVRPGTLVSPDESVDRPCSGRAECDLPRVNRGNLKPDTGAPVTNRGRRLAKPAAARVCPAHSRMLP